MTTQFNPSDEVLSLLGTSQDNHTTAIRDALNTTVKPRTITINLRSLFDEIIEKVDMLSDQSWRVYVADDGTVDCRHDTASILNYHLLFDMSGFDGYLASLNDEDLREYLNDVLELPYMLHDDDGPILVDYVEEIN